MKIELTELERGVILNSLNKLWYTCIERLEKEISTLGDIERRLLHQEKDYALELIKKLEKYD